MAEGVTSEAPVVAGEAAMEGPTFERFARLLVASLPVIPPAPLSAGDRLADLGLTSFGIVQFVVALEDAFEVDFPDEMITALTFASVGSLWEALRPLLDD
jgi:acyl carrier protein